MFINQQYRWKVSDVFSDAFFDQVFDCEVEEFMDFFNSFCGK